MEECGTDGKRQRLGLCPLHNGHEDLIENRITCRENSITLLQNIYLQSGRSIEYPELGRIHKDHQNPASVASCSCDGDFSSLPNQLALVSI